MLRTALLIFAFAGGWLCPQLAALRPLMPVCLIYMLTVVFLQMQVAQCKVTARHWVVLGMNALLPLLIWWGMLRCGVPERFAQTTFFTAITPTATAAPVIVNLLGGSLAFATTGFLISALCMSAVLPIVVPLVLHRPFVGAFPISWSDGGATLWQQGIDGVVWLGEQPVGMVLMRVIFVTLLPMVIAAVLRRSFGERAQRWGKRLSFSTLYVWAALVAIIASAAAETLRAHAADYPTSDIVWVLVIDFALCVVMFALGAWIGYPQYTRECSQLLGQKNTSYTTYLAFACDAPFAALGPAFYVFFHNAWNGIQLIFHRDTANATPPERHAQS